jgi:hypothetical protein
MTQTAVRDAQEDLIWLQGRDVLGHFLDFAVVEAEDGVGSWGGGHGCLRCFGGGFVGEGIFL